MQRILRTVVNTAITALTAVAKGHAVCHGNVVRGANLGADAAADARIRHNVLLRLAICNLRTAQLWKGGLKNRFGIAPAGNRQRPAVQLYRFSYVVFSHFCLLRSI